MRSLRDSNMPKFVFEDVPLFAGLIADLFPGLECPRVAYPQVRRGVLKRNWYVLWGVCVRVRNAYV